MGSKKIHWKDKYQHMTPYVAETPKGVSLYFEKPQDASRGEYLVATVEKLWYDFPEGSRQWDNREGSEKTEILTFSNASEALQYYVKQVYDVDTEYRLNFTLGGRERYCIAQAAYEALELAEFDTRLWRAR